MPKFKYVLDQDVQLYLSKEQGYVRARAEYSRGENQYLVQYLAADGRQVETWWNEDALVNNG